MRRPGIVVVGLGLLATAVLLATEGPTASSAPPHFAAESTSAASAVAPGTFGGVPVIVLSGTHYERGYRHGKELRNKILDVVDNYVLERINPLVYAVMVSRLEGLVAIDEGMAQEARGIVQGAKDAGGGAFSSSRLPRDLTWLDVVAFSAYVDYVGSGCSSVSAWGEATEATDLKGQAVLARNLDWSLDPVLLRNQVLFIHIPKEDGEAPFVSVGFAGFIGCLSCVSESGLGAFLNLGFGSRSGEFPPDHPFTPVSVALRRAVESPGRGTSLVDDFVVALTKPSRVGSFIIHAIAAQSGGSGPAVVVELSSVDHAVRTPADDKDLANGYLVATNHHRKLEKPRECARYDRAIRRGMELFRGLDRDSVWGVVESIRRDDTMQAMLYVPSTGEFWLAVRTAGASQIPTPQKGKLSELLHRTDTIPKKDPR